MVAFGAHSLHYLLVLDRIQEKVLLTNHDSAHSRYSATAYKITRSPPHHIRSLLYMLSKRSYDWQSK